jgi:hypothetical protein
VNVMPETPPTRLGSWASLLEYGFQTAARTMRQQQAAIEKVFGMEPAPPATRPPLEGPTDIDTATSEFGNRVARILRQPLAGPADAVLMMKQLADSSRHCFGYLTRDEKSLGGMLSMPFSLGSLAAQTAIRAVQAMSWPGGAVSRRWSPTRSTCTAIPRYSSPWATGTISIGISSTCADVPMTRLRVSGWDECTSSAACTLGLSKN